jgi:hypothetical protein
MIRKNEVDLVEAMERLDVPEEVLGKQAEEGKLKSLREDAVTPFRTRALFAQAKVAKVARLLEIASRKYNQSADATCDVACCLEQSDEPIEDDLFDAIVEKVTELARISLDREPDYQRGAREVLAKAHTRAKGD